MKSVIIQIWTNYREQTIILLLGQYFISDYTWELHQLNAVCLEILNLQVNL